MDYKITYYLGAGASANSVPIVSEMESRFNDLKRYLEGFLKPPGDDPVYSFYPREIKDNHSVIKGIIEDIEWLIEESINHQTVDNLAKKYFVQDDKASLIRLKRTLITYFTLIQGVNVPVLGKRKTYENIEKRMDNLIACLVERIGEELRLNPKVKIISWNYDLQPDLVLKNYLKSTNIQKVKEDYQLLPNRLMFDEKEITVDFNKFVLLKLNGNALFDYHSDINIPGHSTIFNSEGETEFLAKFLADYINNYKGISKGTQLLNFAWEEHSDKSLRTVSFKKILNVASEIASQTKVLIIIGYSFPFFNSKIDKEILNNMKDVQYIIIQDHNFEEIKNRLLDMMPFWADKYRSNSTFIKKADVGTYYYIHPST